MTKLDPWAPWHVPGSRTFWSTDKLWDWPPIFTPVHHRNVCWSPSRTVSTPTTAVQPTETSSSSYSLTSPQQSHWSQREAGQIQKLTTECSDNYLTLTTKKQRGSSWTLGVPELTCPLYMWRGSTHTDLRWPFLDEQHLHLHPPCLSRGKNIIIRSHPSSQLFDLLPSGWGCRSIKLKTNRLKNSFCLRAIKTRTPNEICIMCKVSVTVTAGLL